MREFVCSDTVSKLSHRRSGKSQRRCAMLSPRRERVLSFRRFRGSRGSTTFTSHRHDRAPLRFFRFRSDLRRRVGAMAGPSGVVPFEFWFAQFDESFVARSPRLSTGALMQNKCPGSHFPPIARAVPAHGLPRGPASRPPPCEARLAPSRPCPCNACVAPSRPPPCEACLAP